MQRRFLSAFVQYTTPRWPAADLEENSPMNLSPKARLTWCAHLLKACTKQHHRELHSALSQLIDSDCVILDVGSHAGQFAKLFARLGPAGHVYAFEPGSYALSILRPAIRFKRLRNVTVIPCGLSDVPSQLDLSVPIKPSGNVGFGLSHVAATDADLADDHRVGWRYIDETIELTTIDRFVAERAIDRVDFIKADIEGWEMRMLMGAEATLARFHPSLMIEVVDRHLERAGDNATALFEYLDGFGYRAFMLDAELTRFVEITQPQQGDIFFLTDGKAAIGTDGPAN